MYAAPGIRATARDGNWSYSRLLALLPKSAPDGIDPLTEIRLVVRLIGIPGDLVVARDRAAVMDTPGLVVQPSPATGISIAWNKQDRCRPELGTRRVCKLPLGRFGAKLLDLHPRVNAVTAEGDEAEEDEQGQRDVETLASVALPSCPRPVRTLPIFDDRSRNGLESWWRRSRRSGQQRSIASHGCNLTGTSWISLKPDISICVEV